MPGSKIPASVGWPGLDRVVSLSALAVYYYNIIIMREHRGTHPIFLQQTPLESCIIILKTHGREVRKSRCKALVLVVKSIPVYPR